MKVESLSFDEIKNRTRLVVLECPWENWDNKDVREMFSKVALLKKKGYEPLWKKGMMPVDSTDLVGDHVIACYEDDKGELHPFTAGRSIDYAKCETYKMNYPPMDYFKFKSGFKDFINITNDHMVNEYKNKKVSYYSSWTIDPDFRKIDKSVVEYSRDLFSALTYHYHTTYDIPHFFCFAVLKFKTDRFFKFWGCSHVQKNGVNLPNINIPRYSDHQLSYMQLNEFSTELRELAMNYTSLWENRVVINKDYKRDINVGVKKTAA